MEANEIIKKWCLWCYNYPTPFENTIKKIWGEGHFADHLIGKWEEYGFAGDARMMRFYLELDTENRNKLAEWVMTNY